MTKAECIAVPFVMPEPEPVVHGALGHDVLSGITCFLDANGDGLNIITEGLIQPILGAYRMKSGMVVLVSESYHNELSCDVVVPTDRKLFYAGTMRPTPAKRFTNCAPGKSWYYERDKRERLSLDELHNILITHAGNYPIQFDCDDLTQIPEATV